MRGREYVLTHTSKIGLFILKLWLVILFFFFWLVILKALSPIFFQQYTEFIFHLHVLKIFTPIERIM